MITVESFRKEFGLILIGAIIFIASFLWKDLFIDIEEVYFPRSQGIGGRLLYTIFITLMLVFLVVCLKDRWHLSTSITVEGDPDRTNLSDNHDLTDNHDI
jgi:hypothetical protein